ncbi:chlorinating enzyme, partial [Pseudomonas sp. MWU12-2115]
IYPDSDHIEEYGGRISLEKYGAVQVIGEKTPEYNRLVTHTTRGKKFEAV